MDLESSCMDYSSYGCSNDMGHSKTTCPQWSLYAIYNISHQTYVRDEERRQL